MFLDADKTGRVTTLRRSDEVELVTEPSSRLVKYANKRSYHLDELKPTGHENIEKMVETLQWAYQDFLKSRAKKKKGRFDMDVWFSAFSVRPSNIRETWSKEEALSTCGTSFCLAGYAAINSMDSDERIRPGGVIIDKNLTYVDQAEPRGREALGLTRYQASFLFNITDKRGKEMMHLIIDAAEFMCGRKLIDRSSMENA